MFHPATILVKCSMNAYKVFTKQHEDEFSAMLKQIGHCAKDGGPREV